MMERSRISILLADPQPLTCAGLTLLLESEPDSDIVGSVDSLPKMLSVIANCARLQLLIVDLDLPGLDGARGLRRMRAIHPHLRIVVIALRLDRETVLELLSAGIHGCIPKTLGSADLGDALSEVLKGRIYVPSLLCDLEPPPSTERRHARNDHALTERQREVLTLMAQGQSNKEIARALRISESTVKVHINAAFRLLDVHNRVSAAAALHRLDAGSDRQPSLPGFVAPRRRSGDVAMAVGVALAILASQLEPGLSLLA